MYICGIFDDEEIERLEKEGHKVEPCPLSLVPNEEDAKDFYDPELLWDELPKYRMIWLDCSLSDLFNWSGRPIGGDFAYDPDDEDRDMRRAQKRGEA